MKKSLFSEITALTKLFCNECFDYHENGDFDKLKKTLENLIDKALSAPKYSREVVLNYIEKGARTAFLNRALSKIQTGQKATEGVTSDDEFALLLNVLLEEYQGDNNYNYVYEMFERLIAEINNISAEFNVIAMQSFNAVDKTYKNNQEMISHRIFSMSKRLNELKENTDNQIETFNAVIDEREKKMHESNITILGIFSAVVLAFNVATGFYSSILEAFSNASIYKVLLIILIIGIIISGTMMGLFYYLEKIRIGAPLLRTKISDEEPNIESHNSNIIQIKRVSFKEKCSKFFKKISFVHNKNLKPLQPFIITIGILLALIIGVFVSWELCIVENRNADYIRTIASEAENSQPTSDYVSETMESTTIMNENETNGSPISTTTQ